MVKIQYKTLIAVKQITNINHIIHTYKLSNVLSNYFDLQPVVKPVSFARNASYSFFSSRFSFFNSDTFLTSSDLSRVVLHIVWLGLVFASSKNISLQGGKL